MIITERTNATNDVYAIDSQLDLFESANIGTHNNLIAWLITLIRIFVDTVIYLNAVIVKNLINVCLNG